MGELINGRTPEKVRFNIAECAYGQCLSECPYDGSDECVEDLLDDAFALIQHLEAAQPKWISVEERKPKEFISVQVYMTDAGDFPSVREGYFVDEDRFYIPALHEFHPVSHWKPFDEPPKEE